MAYNPLTTPKRRRPRRPNEIPNFTSGLESKLLKLIGEPIALAQRVIRKKFEKEVSTNEGSWIRYAYHDRKAVTYMDLEALGSYLIPQTDDFKPLITHTCHFNFRVDLWEDPDGKFRKFSFALEAS
jgi:hypothetical protein